MTKNVSGSQLTLVALIKRMMTASTQDNQYYRLIPTHIMTLIDQAFFCFPYPSSEDKILDITSGRSPTAHPSPNLLETKAPRPAHTPPNGSGDKSLVGYFLSIFWKSRKMSMLS